MRIVIATHNREKAGEMLTILQRRFPNMWFQTLADYPGAPEPAETGSSYAENATIKAESAVRFTNETCIADDAGLEIDALNGAPGLYSKRFAGEQTPFSEKMARILDQMKRLPDEKRKARFKCFVAVASPEIATQVFAASCEGVIAREPSGQGGFGYDPIFFLPERGCTMAQLTADQKHEVSHRGKVLTFAGDYLGTLLKE